MANTKDVAGAEKKTQPKDGLLPPPNRAPKRSGKPAGVPTKPRQTAPKKVRVLKNADATPPALDADKKPDAELTPTETNEEVSGQLRLEGQEATVIPKLEKAAKAYYLAERDRIKATSVRDDAYGKLVVALQEADLREYHSPSVDINPPKIGKYTVTVHEPGSGTGESVTKAKKGSTKATDHPDNVY